MTVSARLGILQTRDGTVWKGQIRFGTNGVTVINAPTESLVTIELTNVSDLFFDPALDSAQEYSQGESFSNPVQKWQAEDIGFTNAAGSVVVDSGFVRVRSVGTNIAGRADAFHFVYRPCDGNGEIVARLVNAQPNVSSKAGIMIRERLSADSPNLFFGIAPYEGGVFQHRDRPGAETYGDPRPELFPPCWLRLKRTGNEFTASSSRNGSTWIRYQSITIPMEQNVWIGLAAAAGQEEIAGVATMDNVAQDRMVPHSSFVPQVYLQSGSIVMGPIVAGDPMSFSVRSFPFTVPATAVSHVLFRWLPSRSASQVRTGTPGLILARSEFVEGDFNHLDFDSLTLSSVLFGFKSYDTDSDLLALVLRRPFTDASSRSTIVTVNGTTLRATDLHIGDFEVSFNEESLGRCTLAMPELLWMRCAQ